MCRWHPIEATTDGKFSVASDVWSFSILLYEMFTKGEMPFAGNADFFFMGLMYLTVQKTVLTTVVVDLVYFIEVDFFIAVHPEKKFNEKCPGMLNIPMSFIFLCMNIAQQFGKLMHKIEALQVNYNFT